MVIDNDTQVEYSHSYVILPKHGEPEFEIYHIKDIGRGTLYIGKYKTINDILAVDYRCKGIVDDEDTILSFHLDYNKIEEETCIEAIEHYIEEIVELNKEIFDRIEKKWLYVKN